MNVGFVGTGAMGEPMARNLLRAGHAVTVFNRRAERSQALVADGATVAATIADAARQNIVISMLADDRATEALVLDGDFVAAMPAHGIHVCMATIGAALADELSATHAAAGKGYVSAPVFGRPPAAAAAQLFVVAAGEEGALDRCQPLFDALGQRTFRVGATASAAHVVKIAGNFMLAAMVEAFGEASALAARHGVAPTQFVEVMTNSVFQVPAYKTYGGLIASGQFEPPGFPLRLGLKDIRLALAAADAKDVALPLASLVRDHYLKALTRGYAELDWAALALISLEDAGAAPRYTTQAGPSSA
ncbi:MAG: NAD(P)-dependent oxidoreductase [Gammaproteobacteria bacterium]